MSEEIEYITSSKVALRHGFFTRKGGVSEKPFDSLNVTIREGDSEANVIENRARALQSLNLDPASLAFLDQLEHSDRIISVTSAARSMDFDGYDAIMTNQSDVVIALSVADCVPVLLVSEADGAVALAHAGWRGCYAQVVPKTIQAMQEEFGVSPDNLVAVIGPSIQVNSYEVKDAVTSQFDLRYIKTQQDKTYLDMQMILTDQLTESGVAEIDNLNIDVYKDERFYSYRRDNGKTGRFLCLASL